MHTQTQAHQPSTMKQRHMNQPCWHRHSNQPCWDIGTWTSHAETQAREPAILRHRHMNQSCWDTSTWTSHAETQAQEPAMMRCRHMNQPCWVRHRHMNQPCWHRPQYQPHKSSTYTLPLLPQHICRQSNTIMHCLCVWSGSGHFQASLSYTVINSLYEVGSPLRSEVLFPSIGQTCTQDNTDSSTVACKQRDPSLWNTIIELPNLWNKMMQ